MTIAEFGERAKLEITEESSTLLPSDELLEKATFILNSKQYVRRLLMSTHQASKFFQNETDFAILVPDKDERIEIYYMMKIAGYYEGIPSRTAYLIKFAYDTLHTINLMTRCYGAPVCDYLLSRNALGTYSSLAQVTSAILGRDIEYVTSGTPLVKNKQLFDGYLSKGDRLVILCSDLAQKVTPEVLRDAEVFQGRLCYNKIPVATFSGKAGVTPGIYDLSRVL